MRVVAVVPAVGLLCGCAVGLLLPGIPAADGIAALIAAALLALSAWRSARSAVFACAVALAFGAGGALLAARAWREAWRPPLRIAFEALAHDERIRADADHRQLPEDDAAFAIVEGTLRADASPTESGVAISIEADLICAPGRPDLSSPACQRSAGGVMATVIGAFAAQRLDAWRAGRRVRAPMQLRRPARYLDPGVPDHERALARRGTTLVATVKSGALVDVLARGDALAEAMSAVRAFARRAIGDAVGRWSARSAGIVAAIVIGDRAGLDPDVQRMLQEAGTYHVIAISGGNIAILAGLLLGAFRLGGLLGRTAMASAIVVLVLYADLVGGGASVDLATLMAVVFFAGRALDQRSPPLNTLAIAATLLAAADPLTIADPAFVLTFGATLAILMVMPVLATLDAPGMLRPLVSMLAASMAAEVVLFPVGALVFSRVTFAGLGLNFLAIPLMGLTQVAGMALVPAALVSTRAAAAIGAIAHAGAAGLVQSAALVRFAPALTYRVAAPSWPAIVSYYAALAAVWTLRTARPSTAAVRSGRIAAMAAASIAALWILAEPWAIVAARGDGRLHVTFLDVGQGDSALVQFPHGATVLVDAGGVPGSTTFDVGDRVVAPVLREAGIRRLGVVALTHGDPDHIGGAPAILQEFRPGAIWEGIPVPRFEPLRALKSEAASLGLAWRHVTHGDAAVFDGVDVRVLHPPEPDWERQKVRNDDSIVIELIWRDVAVLLTGDIGQAVERTLAADVVPAPRRVIKVPHHGSLTSSSADFVRAFAPQVAVVSVGRGNHFGHPAPEVLERYRDIGAEIFRTDQDGAISLETDGRELSLQTFNGRKYEPQRPRRARSSQDTLDALPSAAAGKD